MKLKVERNFYGPDYTIGALYIDGVKFCDTLEDTDRGLESTMSAPTIRRLKIPGETAIPAGTYPVAVCRSPRFGRDLPRLSGVPGYEGILVHAGNTAADTSGCILIGENNAKGKVLNSRAWEARLMEKLKGQTDITIEICRR